MMVNYAKCCCPVPGESITGFITTGRGIVVHAADCTNIAEYRGQQDKWLHIEWSDEVSGSFRVNLRMDVDNKPGVLAALARAVAEQGSNINSVQVDERDSRTSTIRFTIEVRDSAHLARIFEEIGHHDSLIRLTRVKG